jgi:hypothetical protein
MGFVGYSCAETENPKISRLIIEIHMTHLCFILVPPGHINWALSNPTTPNPLLPPFDKGGLGGILQGKDLYF